MTLTKNEKIAAGVGAAAVIVVGIGAAVAASKAKAAVTPPSPTAPAITISVSPTSLPSGGGKITVNGTVNNVPAGTSISILINSQSVNTVTLSGSTFSVSYDVSANIGISAETLSVDAVATVNGATVYSNIVDFTVTGLPSTAPSLVISVAPAYLPASGGGDNHQRNDREHTIRQNRGKHASQHRHQHNYQRQYNRDATDNQ